MRHVALRAGEEIVNAEHIVAILYETVAQVTAQEARAAGD
jgi:hypothetical protein